MWGDWINSAAPRNKAGCFGGKIFHQLFFSGGQRRHTSVLLPVSCGASTVGSSIMQDVLIIAHRHVFRATPLNSNLFTFPQICKYRQGEHVASTNTWNVNTCQNPSLQKKKKKLVYQSRSFYACELLIAPIFTTGTVKIRKMKYFFLSSPVKISK